MIWLKRALPFIVIVALWLGYQFVQRARRQKVLSRTSEVASVTAHLWIASGKYRNDLPRYAAFRDSVLSAHNLTRESLKALVSQYDSDPDWSVVYSTMVNKYVDSLFKVEYPQPEAAKSVAKNPARDSIKALVGKPVPKPTPDSVTPSGTPRGNAPAGR